MLEPIQETTAFLRDRMPFSPRTAIILGTGLGSLADALTDIVAIDYRDIPHFPVSTVEGHNGRLLFGKLDGKEVLAMQGRFHYYEGYSMKEVTYPVRVMRELGIRTLVVSNAAGSVNPEHRLGDLMLITDHINFFPEHPLRGRNIPHGPRFPNMSEAYDRELLRQARAIAAEHHIDVREGVYLGTQGPTSRLPPSTGCSTGWGADAVGHVDRPRGHRGTPLRHPCVRHLRHARTWDWGCGSGSVARGSAGSRPRRTAPHDHPHPRTYSTNLTYNYARETTN